MSFGEVGLLSLLLYYLKARFHFNKNQCADMMLIANLLGVISQLFFMPLLAPLIGEEKLLSIGFFVAFLSMLAYSIAWSVWLKVMVLELLRESDLTLPDDAVEAILDKTILEADLKGDGDRPERVEGFCYKESIYHKEYDSSTFKVCDMEEALEIPIVNDLTMVLGSISQVFSVWGTWDTFWLCSVLFICWV